MHKLSEGFNKMITDKINEQTYEHRERALKYKDDLQRRETIKKEKSKGKDSKYGRRSTHNGKRKSSMASSYLEEDSENVIFSNDNMNDNAKANEKFL